MAEGPRDAQVSWNFGNCCTTTTNSIWKHLQSVNDLLAHIRHFLFMVSRNVSVLHRFLDITTFIVYVTARDLEKSFSKHIVVNTCHISGGIWVRKVSDSKSDLQSHSRSLVLVHSIWFPITSSLPLYLSVSCTVSEILSSISYNLKRSRDSSGVMYHACARSYSSVCSCTPNFKCV